MDVVEAMHRRGGLASRASLVAATSRADVDRALKAGTVVRVSKGRYTLPEIEAAKATAHAMNAVLASTSAALYHGWEVKKVPEKPHVLVPRKRNVPPRWRSHVTLHRADLHSDDLSGGIATSRELTLLHCLRGLPDDEALTIADSALRAGEDLTLSRVLASVQGAGRSKVRRIGAAASGLAANPFESCLRALALTVPGLDVVPQRVISGPHVWARPDLVDVARRLVLEADSWEFHAGREGFTKDVRRYTLLSAEGWTVLRFLWKDVMFAPKEVRAVLNRAVCLDDTRTEVLSAWPFAA